LTVRIAYLECATGISGDMTLAALIDLGVDEHALRSAIDSLGLPGVELEVREIVKAGFRATKVDVRHPEQHAHRHFSDIQKILAGAKGLAPSQRELAEAIFLAVAQAEATVHGSTVEQVHFHEVGAIDSIVDIVGAAVGFDLLKVDRIVCGPLPTGRGSVKIDHGICPIPTPGTAELLRGLPTIDLPVQGELTTPTGAAIVRTLADEFGALPAMTIDRIGYGAGTMELPGRANLLRIFVGEATLNPLCDVVTLLETNLDDVTGEVIGYTKQLLMQSGALDVYTTSIAMKKDRPGTVLSVLCRPQDADTLSSLLFAQTATLGIRRSQMERVKQSRSECTVETPWGEVGGKIAWLPGEPATFSPEFEDCATLAQSAGVTLREVMRAAIVTFENEIGEAYPEESTEEHGHSHDHDHDHDHDGSQGHSHDHDRPHDHDHG